MQMDKKIISIVTPSYNQGRFIEAAIRSVLSQAGDFYIDYIIMDGKSGDETVSIIKKYEKLLQEHCTITKKNGMNYYVKKNNDFLWHNCAGISYRWRSEKDNGQVDALNRGFEIAQGDIFAFLNSDDAYYEKVFKKVAHQLRRGDDFVYGKGMWIDEAGEDILCYPTFKPTIYGFYYQCTLCQPTVFFTRSVFRELGNFSNRHQHAFDFEYWLRALCGGKKFRHINRVTAKSRMYIENKSLSLVESIRQEIRDIKETYYGQPGNKLNRIKLFLNRLTIHFRTVIRVNKLQKRLGTGIRHKFF
jgi:glycosyltransferase involved in cell wall biosynthesis